MKGRKEKGNKRENERTKGKIKRKDKRNKEKDKMKLVKMEYKEQIKKPKEKLKHTFVINEMVKRS